jgi:hypothetical protein
MEIELRRTEWAGHVARVGKNRSLQGFKRDSVNERDLLKIPEIDGSVILRWICKK